MPPISASTVEHPYVKLVPATKSNSPDEPVQLAFSVIDESGREEMVTGFCPMAANLYSLFQENGWLQTRTAEPISMKRAVG
jgi:hypothetical protein